MKEIIAILDALIEEKELLEQVLRKKEIYQTLIENEKRNHPIDRLRQHQENTAEIKTYSYE